MPALDLNDKAESAAASLLRSAVDLSVDGQPLFGLHVYEGKWDGRIEEPSAICSAETTADTEQDPPFSGNFWIDLEVVVTRQARPQGDEADTGTVDTSRALVNAVFAIYLRDDLAEALSALVDDFTIFSGSLQFMSQKSAKDDEGKYIDILPMRFLACNSDV